MPVAWSGAQAEAIRNSIVDKDQLSRGDSWTILGVLLGVLFVIVLPPLYAKIPIFFAVCVGITWLAFQSHWVTKRPSAQKLFLAALVITICSVIAIPQFRAQWVSEHAKARTTFDVNSEYLSNGMVVYGLAIWNVQKEALYPVGIATYLRVENNGPVAEMIDSVELEIKTESNTWEPLENNGSR